MGKELRRGDYASLNIYFLSGLHDGNPNKLYGEGEFPYVQHVERSDGFLTDGVRLDFNTMPGGHPIDNNTFYGHGISATHEIGHWMGLMHPWTHPERGDPCHADDTNEGDQIVDTPPQTLEWRHCYKSIEKYDSCPGQDGFDSKYCSGLVILSPYLNTNSVSTNRYTQLHVIHRRPMVSAALHRFSM